MYSKMLIPLDGSKTAEQVLPYVRLFTDRFKQPVDLLAMIDAEALAVVETGSDRPAFDSFVEELVQNSKEYLQGIANSFDRAGITYEVSKGAPAEAIIQRGEADVAILIAMATHGRSGVHRWLLGSVTEKVLRATVNPLLLIRATEHPPPGDEAVLRSVVVPLDGSAVADSVLPMVAGLAKQLDLAVILLRVYNLPVTTFIFGHGYYAFNMETFMTIVKETASEYLTEKAAELKRLGVEQVSCVIREGLGADEIIKCAAEAPDRLIALCSHGRSGIHRWVLGSVTETVVRHTSNPVLVLRAK